MFRSWLPVFDLPYRFADPWLLGLASLVVACWLLMRRGAGRGTGALVISSLASLRGATASWRVRYRRVLLPVRLLAGLLLALDVSGSMLDSGLSAGSKLDGAKQALKDFIAQRKNDRVGLVIFESESRVMSPLTLDYHALQQIVERVDNGLVPDGTAIGLGIASSTNLLRDSTAKSKVIILATDGENNQHRLEPESAAAIAKQLNIKLYTIGMFAKGETLATTQIDEQGMRQWATQTGGFYGRAQSGADLRRIFDRISQLETSQILRLHFTSFDELAGWFLVPALGLLSLEVTLAGTVFRRVP